MADRDIAGRLENAFALYIEANRSGTNLDGIPVRRAQRTADAVDAPVVVANVTQAEMTPPNSNLYRCTLQVTVVTNGHDEDEGAHQTRLGVVADLMGDWDGVRRAINKQPAGADVRSQTGLHVVSMMHTGQERLEDEELLIDADVWVVWAHPWDRAV